MKKSVQLRTRTITGIFGKSGYGKTTYAMQLALASKKRFLFLDVTNTFGIQGDKRFDNLGEVVDSLNEFLNGTISRLRIYGDGKVNRGIIRGFARLIKSQTPLNCILVLDEVQRYAGTYSIYKPLRYIIDEGRHSGLDLIYTSRRLSEVNVYVRSQSDVLITFRQDEPLDLEILKKISTQWNLAATLERGKPLTIRSI